MKNKIQKLNNNENCLNLPKRAINLEQYNRESKRFKERKLLTY